MPQRSDSAEESRWNGCLAIVGHFWHVWGAIVRFIKAVFLWGKRLHQEQMDRAHDHETGIRDKKKCRHLHTMWYAPPLWTGYNKCYDISALNGTRGYLCPWYNQEVSGNVIWLRQVSCNAFWKPQVIEAFAGYKTNNLRHAAGKKTAQHGPVKTFFIAENAPIRSLIAV